MEVYRILSRREDDFCIENSFDGVTFKQMRICHMFNVKNEIAFGIYACSAENSSFKATFMDMELTECKWLAHDGTVLTTCMAKPMEGNTWELCKLGFNKNLNHAGAGSMVFEAAMNWAINHGAGRLFLISNSKLSPA